MYLVQLLLPMYDNTEKPFSEQAFDTVRKELIQQFGGVTAFFRSPAAGFWQKGHGQVSRDDIVIFEVMADQLDRGWWVSYKETLQVRFNQDELVVRVSQVEMM